MLISSLPELLTPREVAEFMRVSHCQLMNWLRAGELPGIKIAGTWRIPKVKLLQALDLGGIGVRTSGTPAARVTRSSSSR